MPIQQQQSQFITAGYNKWWLFDCTDEFDPSLQNGKKAPKITWCRRVMVYAILTFIEYNLVHTPPPPVQMCVLFAQNRPGEHVFVVLFKGDDILFPSVSGVCCHIFCVILSDVGSDITTIPYSPVSNGLVRVALQILLHQEKWDIAV